ncbi:MAG: hypothetical protein ACRERU_05710 [Methylococcales bacterium]
MSKESISDEVEMEKHAIEMANQGRFSEARKIFLEVIPMKTNPLHRAEVMRNVMLTFDKEGNKDDAIATGREIPGIPELCSCLEGEILFYEISARISALEGVPLVERRHALIALLTAWFTGSAMGAAIGAKIECCTYMGR